MLWLYGNGYGMAYLRIRPYILPWPIQKYVTLQMSYSDNYWMMEGGHFLIHMQKTGPKLAIFHGFFGQNVKNSGLPLWKLAAGLGGSGADRGKTWSCFMWISIETHINWSHSYFISVKLIVDSSKFRNNVAGSTGEGIYLTDLNQISNSVFNMNDAKLGGSIYLSIVSKGGQRQAGEPAPLVWAFALGTDLPQPLHTNLHFS